MNCATAIELAARNKHPETCLALLKAGASPDAKYFVRPHQVGSFGAQRLNNALLASNRRHLNRCRYATASQFSSAVPFMWAAVNGMVEVMQAFVEAGWDVNDETHVSQETNRPRDTHLMAPSCTSTNYPAFCLGIRRVGIADYAAAHRLCQCFQVVSVSGLPKEHVHSLWALPTRRRRRMPCTQRRGTALPSRSCGCLTTGQSSRVAGST